MKFGGSWTRDPRAHYLVVTIVKDCEAIRQILIGEREKSEDRKWTILGQSFGGFCAINYLSYYSEGLKEVFLTGGLAPIVNHPDSVYEALIGEFISVVNNLWLTVIISLKKG